MIDYEIGWLLAHIGAVILLLLGVIGWEQHWNEKIDERMEGRE